MTRTAELFPSRRPRGAFRKAPLPAALLAALLFLALAPTDARAQTAFIRGDSNADGVINIADAVFSLSDLFILGSAPPAVPEALDVNDNGVSEISDVARLLAYLFVPGTAPPPAPFPTAGFDTTPASFPAAPTGAVTLALSDEIGCANTQSIMTLSITNNATVEALSIRLEYDPGLLALAVIDDAPLAAILGENPDFFTTTLGAGEAIVGTLFSFLDPTGNGLAPQVDAAILNLTFNVGPSLGPSQVATVELVDDLGGPDPIYNMASIAGEAERAAVLPGTITGSCTAPEYRRGDFNEDGAYSVTDAVNLIEYLFVGGAATTCEQVADANADGGIDVADVIALLDAILGAGPALPAPFPGCGISPTASALDCVDYLGGCP